MPEPFDRFIEYVDENDVDKTLLKLPTVEKTLDNLEKFGNDFSRLAIKMFKRHPQKPSGPTPDYQESAFINRKPETTLYNVTNRENEVPIITRTAKLIKDTSISVQGLSCAATYKKDENAYSLIAGEKVGINYTKDTPHYDSGITFSHKVGNNKNSIEYFSRSAINTYSVSLFNQDSNFGVTAHYANHNGFNSTVSIDKNSVSGECSYDKENKNCKMQFGAYATSGENYSNPFVGVRGRITF